VENPPGQIRHALRETRINAIKSSGRLAPVAKITILYSMLYDSDSRVRALALEALSAAESSDIETFIKESGHARVLDFLAHNLPKGSPILPLIARSPSLTKHTRNYLESLNIVPDSKVIELKRPEAAKEGRKEPKDESSGLEWTPAEDVDLPEGVEFSMPTVEGEAQEDTVPVLKKPSTPLFVSPPSKEPEVEVTGQEKYNEGPITEEKASVEKEEDFVADSGVPDEAAEVQSQAPEVSDEASAGIEEKGLEHESAVQGTPTEEAPIWEKSDEEVVTEDTGESVGRIPAQETPVKETPVEEAPPPAFIPSQPSRASSISSAAGAVRGEGLFPVYKPKKIPTSATTSGGRARGLTSVKPGVIVPAVDEPFRKARDEKGGFLRWILLGFLIGFGLVALFVLAARFLPALKEKLNNQKIQNQTNSQSQVIPASPETMPDTTNVPSDSNVNLFLGTFASNRALEAAKSKIERLGLTAKITQKTQEETVYVVSSSASGSQADANRTVSGIRAVGIPASIIGGSGGKWTISCGEFPTEAEAKKRAIALRASGYSGRVSPQTTKKTVYTLMVVNVANDRKNEIMSKLKQAGLNVREAP